MLFFLIMEFLSLQQVPAGCIYRVGDTEARMAQFLYSSGGSKAAYALAGITLDWLERLILFTPIVLLMKFFVLGTLMPTWTDLALTFCFSVYDMTKIIFNFHTVSYLFDHKESVIKFSGLFSGLLYSFQMSGSMVSLSNYDSQATEMSFISRTSYVRSGFNMLLPLIPDGNPWFDKIKAKNQELYGGPWKNLGIMMIHMTLAVLLVLFIDSRANRIKKENPKKNPKTETCKELKDQQELKNEQAFAGSGTATISVNSIEKTHNKNIAVSDITFAVEQKQMFVLVGPNGAGKTSILEVLAGVSPRSNGEIKYERTSIEEYNNKHLSFCLQKNILWDHLTFRDHVELIGRWRGIPDSTLQQLIQELDIALQLDKSLDTKAVYLSAGNKRKLNVVLGLLSAPKVFVLDEPTAGMDPVAKR